MWGPHTWASLGRLICLQTVNSHHRLSPSRGDHQGGARQRATLWKQTCCLNSKKHGSGEATHMLFGWQMRRPPNRPDCTLSFVPTSAACRHPSFQPEGHYLNECGPESHRAEVETFRQWWLENATLLYYKMFSNPSNFCFSRG